MTMTHGPVVIRRRLGFVLKQLRGQRGLHLDVVARQLEISPSKLSRLETGQVEPKIRDVRDLLDIYDAGTDVREQIMEWATDATQPGWWQPFSVEVPADLDLYISLEAEAQSVRIYSTPISGLLQTADYARAILRGVVPHTTAQELDTLVEVRLGRQRVIDAYFDTPNEISRYRAIWNDVLAKALDPDASRRLIGDLIPIRRQTV